MRISYKSNSLISWVMYIALVGEIGSAIGARSGINKMQVKTQLR